jgi:excisionase family DNA binding protein
MPEQETLKVAEVAKRLRVDPRTVRRMIDRGDLRGVRVGRLYRVPVDALEAYLRGERPSE